jgi:hypothetical protein
MANANPKTGGLWLRLSLSRITFIIWLAWLSSVALMWGMYRFNVMHPHFLPLTTLLVIQLIGGLAVLLAGLWALVRGPQRARAFSWLLLGTTPIWLWAAHISYGMWVGHSRSVPWFPGPVVKLGAPAASALLDGIVRYQYPNRLEGQRVVMVYDQVPDPAGDIAAMDRFVQQVEELLGRRCKTKVHWIRGGVIGLGPKYNQGLAFGPAVTDQPGLTWIDRHEVAHFVLHHHCGPDNTPPSLLQEGWAETQSGQESVNLARAWRLKRNDEVLTLRELTNDYWYNNREGRIYTRGGILVEFILREYGPKKLFELYTTCRPKTFADDCGRILGVDLDELDRRCWADVEKQVSQMGELYGPNPFQHVKVGEGVDLVAWNAFIEQYLSGQKQLEATYRQVQMEIESTRYNYSADGTKMTSTERFIVAHDGDRHRRMHEMNGHATVSVAAHAGSFILHRKSDDSQWTQAPLPHPDMPRLAYSYCRNFFQDREESLRIPNRRLPPFLHGLDVTITAFEQFAQNGQNRVRISYRDSFVWPKGRYLKNGSVVFRTDAYCTLQSANSSATYKDGKVAVDRRLEIEYDPMHVGVPVVRTIRSESERSYNSNYVQVISIPRCDFVPTPEKEFTLAAFDVAPPGRWAWLGRIGVPWHMVVTCSGAAISLVLGMAIQGWQLVRKGIN